MSLVHCELHTGIAAEYSRSAFSDTLIDVLRPLALSSRGAIPVSNDCSIQINRRGENAIFVVHFRSLIPVSAAALVVERHDEDEIWKQMIRLSEWSLPEFEPHKPQTRPWLASTLLPGHVHAQKGGLFWLPDFERRLAWALMESSPGMSMNFSI